MIRVKSCCCGCSLREASLGILGMTMALNVVFTFLSIVFFYSIGRPLSKIAESEFVRLTIGTQLIVNVYAVWGICGKRPRYLWPFLIVSVLEITIFVFIMYHLGTSNTYIALGKWYDIELGVIILVIIFGALALLLSYFTVVVYSYYKQMVGEMSTTDEALAQVIIEEWRAVPVILGKPRYDRAPAANSVTNPIKVYTPTRIPGV